MTLSQARAETVRDARVRRRVAAERPTVRGFSEAQPKVPNTPADGKDDPR